MQAPLTLQSLPLFPLGAVLFPDGQLSLRVFELRYLDMIRKCHQAGAPFGVVGLTAGSEVRQPGVTEQFYDMGTLARIDEVQTVQAGLLMVRASGVQRFSIVRRERLPNGLWVADVEQVPPDLRVEVPEELRSIAQALERVLTALQARGDAAPGLPEAPWNFLDCAWVANRWCELLPVQLELRQRLMSLDNPLVRLELVGDILARTGIG